jgi:HPt (histidine-containing phosphotransfer) domain-containing protein
VPVIALTANALSGNREMFLSKGFDSYISKPIDVLQLDRELNRWVRPRHMQERRMGERRGEDRRRPDHFPEVAMKDRFEPAGVGPRPEKNLENLKNLLPPLSLLKDVHLEGVNLEEGVLRYGGEAEYMVILRSFLKHIPEVLDSLRTVGEDIPKEYAIAVHGLKGASRSIGATEPAALAEELETAAKAGDFRAVAEKNGVLLESFETLLKNIEKTLDAPALRTEQSDPLSPATSQKPKKLEPDLTLLKKIREGAASFKTSLMEETLTKLEEYAYERDEELISWLRARMENLEYDAVEERLKQYIDGKIKG